MKSATLKTQNRFSLFCTQAATLITGVILSLLAFATFIFTYKLSVERAAYEEVNLLTDNIFINIFLLIIFFSIALLCIWKHVKVYKIDTLIIILIMVFITTLLCSLWNMQTELLPYSDSSVVTGAAVDAANNNYETLLEGPNKYAFDPNYYNNHSYFAFYSFQLGYVFIAEILFRIFGTGVAFFTLKFINIIAIDFAYIALVLIINKLQKNKTITNLSAIAFSFCLQPVFFSVFTYGNLLGLAFSMWAVYFAISYIKENKLSKIIISIPLIILAVISKYNYMIVAIAIAICLILHVINKKKFIALLMAVLIIISPILSQKLVIKSYELRANTTYETEVKQIEYACAGAFDGANPGWYNGISLSLLLDNNMNQNAADTQANRMLKDRLNQLIKDPVQLIKFYSKKILTQYIEPTFESIWLCQFRTPVDNKVSDFEKDVYTGTIRDILDSYFDFYVMIMYIGFAAYLIRMFIKKISTPENIMIPVCVLGGFIYHLIFEAKSQYIMTYFIMIIPFSIAGIYYLSKYIFNKSSLILSKKAE